MGVRSKVLGDARLRRLSRKALFAVNPGAQRFYKNIDEAFQGGRWQEVVDLAEGSNLSQRWYMSPLAYTKLAQSHAHLGSYKRAAKALKKGAMTYPSSVALAKARAELAMVMEDWTTAALAWDTYDTLQDPHQKNLSSFPLRGSDFTWFDQNWVELARHWAEAEAAKGNGVGGRRPSARAAVRTLETIRALGAADVLLDMSEWMLVAYPDVPGIVSRVCETILRVSDFRSVDEAATTLEQNYPLDEVRAYTSRMRDSTTLLDQLVTSEWLAREEVRVLNISRDSGAAGAVFARGLWTPQRIHSEAMELSRRDSWPEGPAVSDTLSHAAWHQARRFARGRGEILGIHDDDLARAVFHNIKHELILKIPIDRIANEIVRTHDGGPVFINLSNLRFTYLVAYPWSAFGSIYLYEALRERGLPVYFVRFPTDVAVSRNRDPFEGPAGPTLVARSQGSGLRPPKRTWEPLPDQTNHLVVPSGIRSVATLLERTGDAVVLNSGAPLKAYAYDRSFRQGWDYPVHSSVHPWWKLPEITISTRVRQSWIREENGIERTRVVPGAHAEVTLATGRWPSGTWHELLEQAIMPYFTKVVTRARELMETWGTTDVHIGDYLYVESSLVAAVGAERGARIHIWPHSANPVHVALHAHDRIASVRAVTRSGMKTWAEYVDPEKVSQDPTGVVRDSVEPVEWSSGKPLSLVLIGGRPVMRDLPVLDLEAHEWLYRSFLEALDPLVQSGKLRVYFKPRGLSGEHEGWLESLVGRAASWQPVLGHPLRIDLPNPVYVSVSVASTALIEGVSRGIPGFVLREGSARDYLALEPGSLQVFTLAQALDWLQSHLDEETWHEWRTQQADWLALELAPAEPVRTLAGE